MEQLVARWAHNPKVTGSSPVPATITSQIKGGFLFVNTFKVYVLYSRKFDKLYIGCSSNLTNRLISHNELGVKDWTRSYRLWLLIYLEEYPSKSEALKREKQLKSGQGREFLRKEILPHFL